MEFVSTLSAGIQSIGKASRLRILLPCLLMGWVVNLLFCELGSAAEEEKKGEDSEFIIDPKTGQKKKKPPIPAFKCSAWCAFRNYSEFISQEKKKKLPAYKTDQSKPGSGYWGGYGRKGHWVSLVVEVQNTTKPKKKITFKGNMNIRLDPSKETEEGDTPYKSSYTQTFEVPPESKRLYYFSVLCPEFHFRTIDIAINADGRTYTRQVDLQDLDEKNNDLIVVVSEQAGAFKYLIPRAPRDPLAMKQERGRAVSVVRPNEMPRRWHDLAIADLIIIDGPPKTALDDRQLNALEGYLQNGGRVLVNAAKDPSRFKPAEGNTRSIAELAGIEVQQSGTVNSLDQLDPPYKPKEDTKWELPVVDIRPIRDRSPVAISRNTNDLIERMDRDIGRGSITVLSFSLRDERLQTWAGRSQIPLELLSLGRRRPLFKYQEPQQPQQTNPWGFEPEPQVVRSNTLPGLRQHLDDSFAKDTPVETPKRPLVASFLLLYLLAAVPINYFIFGWFRRREIAWLAVPAWSVAFGVIAYVVGYMGQLGKLTINEVSVVEAGVNQKTAIGRTFIGIYAPRRGYYNLAFTSPEEKEEKGFDYMSAPGHLISPAMQTRGLTDLPELKLKEDNDNLLVRELLIQARSTRRLETVHRVDFGEGLNISMAKDPAGGGHTISIQNNTPHHLINMAVLRQGKASNVRSALLGDLPSGNQSERTVSSGEWTTLENAFLNRRVAFRSSMGHDTTDRKSALINYIGERLVDYRSDLLLAWMDGGMQPVTVDGEAPGRKRGLSLLILPFQAGQDRGKRRKIAQKGQWPLRYAFDIDVLNKEDISWKPLVYEKGQARLGLRSTKEALLFLKISVPNQVRRMTNRSLKLNFSLVALKPGMRGAPRFSPTRYRGQLAVEARTYSGERDRWTPQKVSITNIDLTPKTPVPVSITLFINSTMLDEDNSILLKVRIKDLQTTGTLPPEEVQWPLAIRKLSPLEFSGTDLRR